jgi:hypothetical protein
MFVATRVYGNIAGSASLLLPTPTQEQLLTVDTDPPVTFKWPLTGAQHATAFFDRNAHDVSTLVVCDDERVDPTNFTFCKSVLPL